VPQLPDVVGLFADVEAAGDVRGLEDTHLMGAVTMVGEACGYQLHEQGGAAARAADNVQAPHSRPLSYSRRIAQ
jgi:hypothetical protein